MPRIVTFAKTAALWSLWVLCILLILPVLLSVPGKPTDAELGLYLAVLLSVTGYPVVLPFLAVLERGARRRSNQAGLHVIRIAMWGSFLAVLATLGTLGASFYAHERAKPVLSRDEIIEGSYPNAILMDDTEWMDRLIKEGASVDHRLPTFNQTPAVMSASFGQWSLVAFLLSRGADPDLKDNQGKSVRTLAAVPDLPPRKPADAAALEQIRARLAHK